MLAAVRGQIAIGVDTAHLRRERAAVFRHGHIGKRGHIDPKSAKGERCRDQRRAAGERFYRLDRDPMSGRSREQNSRSTTISGMQILHFDPAAKQRRMRLIKIGRARLNFAVDIAKDLDRHAGRQRQDFSQEPVQAKKIRIIGTRNYDAIVPPKPHWHGVYGGIEQGVPLVWNEFLERRRLFVIEMYHSVRLTYGIEFDCEHLLVTRSWWQPDPGTIAQGILTRLQIMRVEQDWTCVPLMQTDCSRHAEKMIAVDESN